MPKYSRETRSLIDKLANQAVGYGDQLQSRPHLGDNSLNEGLARALRPLDQLGQAFGADPLRSLATMFNPLEGYKATLDAVTKAYHEPSLENNLMALGVGMTSGPGVGAVKPVLEQFPGLGAAETGVLNEVVKKRSMALPKAKLYHGTTQEAAVRLLSEGPDLSRAGANYDGFSLQGPGLYTTTDAMDAARWGRAAATRNNEPFDPLGLLQSRVPQDRMIASEDLRHLVRSMDDNTRLSMSQMPITAGEMGTNTLAQQRVAKALGYDAISYKSPAGPNVYHSVFHTPELNFKQALPIAEEEFDNWMEKFLSRNNKDLPADFRPTGSWTEALTDPRIKRRNKRLEFWDLVSGDLSGTSLP